MQYDHEILLLQGGGALGAYQAGVYEGLVEAGVAPTWVVGISIGAINASLIVGNPPEQRVERLREFWQRVSRDVGPPLPAWLDPLRPTVNHMAAMSAATFGIRAFFTPRMPPASFAADGTEGALSVYDTTPLKATLEELVDFDLINSGQVRLSLGAVDVRKGTSIYFDTKSTQIHADHVRASGALPPGFPPVTIDGEHYWDGGVVSNTPITYVSDARPLTTARIIQVDVFNSQGELPRNLSQVSERAKDIQYASRTRLNIEQIREIGELRAACRRLVGKLPPALKSDPDAIKLAAACDEQKLDDHSPDQYAPLKVRASSRTTSFPALRLARLGQPVLKTCAVPFLAGIKSGLRSALGFSFTAPPKLCRLLGPLLRKRISRSQLVREGLEPLSTAPKHHFLEIARIVREETDEAN